MYLEQSANHSPQQWKNHKSKLRLQEEPLFDRAQSGKAIYRMAKKYYSDLGGMADTTLNQFYDFVRQIPYVEDAYGEEVIARPLWLLSEKIFPGSDCKKKAVLMGAWAEAHGVPWRLIAVSERPDKMIHHVFPQFKIRGLWENVDATYPEYRLFEAKPQVTAGEELLR